MSTACALGEEVPYVGEKIRLTHVLAVGGAAVIWAGRHEAISLDVAVKLIHRHIDNAMASLRLQREARILAHHRHPALVRVFDFGIEDGASYLVMDRLSGGTLTETGERYGRLESQLAVSLLMPVVDALEKLHRHGIVHRDIKPDNIMLARDRESQLQPKLLDFGVAQIEDPEGDFGPTPDEPGPVGTPGYLAPEQALLEPTDGRADVWGLCVTLFEMISGEPLFPGAGLAPVIATRRPGGEADVAAWCPDMPPELAAILQKGVASHPSDRWSGMMELRCALVAWLEAHDIVTDAAE